MKTRQYVVRIDRDPGSDWGASVPAGFAKTALVFHGPAIGE